MEDELINLLKKYVAIFLNEYEELLTKDNLETLRNIDYQNIFVFDDVNVPFGTVFLGKIYLSNSNNLLINGLKEMPNYNRLRKPLNNKNLSSYLKYMCDNGYNLMDFYSDILMYFVFSLIIKEDTFLYKGLINQEMKLLSIKYHLRIASLYAREEKIINRISSILGYEVTRKLLFMDIPTGFKYLNDNYGFRYAKLFSNLINLVDEEYHKIDNKDYNGVNGIIEYTNDYDHLSYGSVYNYLLDFEAENIFTN